MLIGCFVFVSLFNIFQNSYITLQSIEYALQLLIEYLTNFQSYIEERRIQIVDSKWTEGNDQRKDPFTPSEEACPRYSYRSRVINRNPLIIYIENFLGKSEIDHLIKLA